MPTVCRFVGVLHYRLVMCYSVGWSGATLWVGQVLPCGLVRRYSVGLSGATLWIDRVQFFGLLNCVWTVLFCGLSGAVI